MSAEAFVAAIRDAGLNPPADIIPDGKIHRFSTNCRADDDAGWYLYVRAGDGVLYPVGAYGCRRSGLLREWHSRSGDQTQILSSAQELEARFVRLSLNPASVQAPANDWLIEGWQPRGIGFTYGTTGYLKSFAELWQAVTAAAGRPIFGHPISTPSGQLRALIFHTEDNADRVEYDLNRMASRMDMTPAEISAVRENLRIVPVPDLDFKADLVMLDTMSGMEPGGGDFGEKAMTILRGFYTIMSIAGCGIHALAHVSKEVSRNDLRDVGSILGSSLYGNKCRIARWVSKPTADEMACAPQAIRDLQDKCRFHSEIPAISIMGVSKISHAAPIDDLIWLGRSSGGIVVERVAAEGGDSARLRALDARRAKASEAVLAILADRPGGLSPHGLDAEAKVRGCARDMARLAVEDLLASGRVVEIQVNADRRGPKPRVYRLV